MERWAPSISVQWHCSSSGVSGLLNAFMLKRWTGGHTFWHIIQYIIVCTCVSHTQQSLQHPIAKERTCPIICFSRYMMVYKKYIIYIYISLYIAYALTYADIMQTFFLVCVSDWKHINARLDVRRNKPGRFQVANTKTAIHIWTTCLRRQFNDQWNFTKENTAPIGRARWLWVSKSQSGSRKDLNSFCW